ncbi:hypothetical protein PanWU01x14_272510 [Parasponia andersonii]|uniref:Uncharacterized protein n=1 Tax=Parasponia andersonii TaxID=3476 RepID=A0A2P5B4C0_PARAD|nr:hypothetical protein PanWU01x14_272510 [Parasponia andersonii]
MIAKNVNTSHGPKFDSSTTKSKYKEILFQVKSGRNTLILQEKEIMEFHTKTRKMGIEQTIPPSPTTPPPSVSPSSPPLSRH